MPGDRVKTDVRDARHLAELVAAGLVWAVCVPSVEQEAARDLTRARADAQIEFKSAANRLTKLLLRYGIVYGDGPDQLWTKKHLRWLVSLRFDQADTQATFDDYLAPR